MTTDGSPGATGTPTSPPAYPQYPPPGYAPVPYPPAPPALPGTNGFAIASLVLGIVWIWWIGSVLALVFGYKARKQIREQGQSGDGMAIAGIGLGWIGVAFLVMSIGLIATSGGSGVSY